MTEPMLILMCGLPFSGKTAVARTIATERGWHYISLDAINTERGMGFDGKSIALDEWTLTYAEAYWRVHELLMAGFSVVFDDTNFLRYQRDQLREIASSCKAQASVLYVPTPEAEVRKRWWENRVNSRRGDVRDDDFALVVRQFEPPTPDEHVIVYDPLVPITSPDDFIAQILYESSRRHSASR